MRIGTEKERYRNEILNDVRINFLYNYKRSESLILGTNSFSIKYSHIISRIYSYECILLTHSLNLLISSCVVGCTLNSHILDTPVNLLKFNFSNASSKEMVYST